MSETYRHRRRGTLYTVVGTASLQTAMPAREGEDLIVYRGTDEVLWARPITEFFDGRFEKVATPPRPETVEVPAEPTEAMLSAGHAQLHMHGVAINTYLGVVLRRAYAAMLSARPTVAETMEICGACAGSGIGVNGPESTCSFCAGSGGVPPVAETGVEALLAAEWTEGCSPGAAARKLCRCLSGPDHPLLRKLLEAMLAHQNETYAEAASLRAKLAEAERDAAREELSGDRWRIREAETQEALQAIGEEFGVRGGEPRTSGIRRVLTEQRAALAAWQEVARRSGVCMTCAISAPEPYGCTDCLNTGWDGGAPAGFTPEATIAARDKRIAELTAGLGDLVMFYRLSGEDALDHFERVAEQFYRDTSYLRPGKDCRLHGDEVRRAKWDEWVDAKVARARALLAGEAPPAPRDGEGDAR